MLMLPWLVLALLWTLAVLAGCALPSDSLPSSAIWSFDKVVHLVIFGGFGILWMQALKQVIQKPVQWVMVAGVTFALATEVIQAFVPGRAPDPLDALADVVGLSLGVGLCLLWQRRPVIQT